jgi:magnesium chelatase family protein
MEQLDFQFIKGQEHVKRALEVAAAGGHHIKITGAPGTGKTMLAKALRTILPPLTEAEAALLTAIYGNANMLPLEIESVEHRPFSTPHATTSQAGLIGTIKRGIWRPGAISLAHGGILHFESLPEFAEKRKLIPSLVANRSVTITLNGESHTYPADALIVATQRPCRCGWFGDVMNSCTCSVQQLSAYCLSPELAGCFDLHVEAPTVSYERMTNSRLPEPSAAVRARVIAAWQRQQGRASTRSAWRINATLTANNIKEYCWLDSAGQSLMKAAARQLNFTQEDHDRTLRVARTIADLAGRDEIGPADLAETIQYRYRRAK